MKEFQLKQLIKEVIRELAENVKSKHKSPEHEVASDMLDSDYIQPAFNNDANAKKYLSNLWDEDWFTIKNKLISVSDEMNSPWMDWFQDGVDRFLELNRAHIASLGEAFGITHDITSPADTNTMNKSTIKESPDARKKRLMSVDYDTGVKLLYMWVNKTTINYKEFEELLADFMAKFVKDLSKVAPPPIIKEGNEDYFPMYFRKVNQLVKTTGYESALAYIFELVKTGKLDEPRFNTLIHLLVRKKMYATIKESEGLSSREMISYFKKVRTLVSTTGADSALKYIFELAQAGKIDEPAFKLMVYFCTKRSPINPR